MSVTAELQKLIIDTLKADAAVAAIVGTDVFDYPPSSDPFPRITMGPGDTIPDEADCVDGIRATQQVDCWSRDGGNTHPCRALVDAVRRSLHEQALSLPSPYVLNTIRVEQTRVFPDQDPLTTHGVVVVTALVEE